MTVNTRIFIIFESQKKFYYSKKQSRNLVSNTKILLKRVKSNI